MRQKTVKLSEPVEWAGQTYTQLTMKKLKVKHMLEVDWSTKSNGIEQAATLAAASAGVDVGVIHELDMDDFATIQEVMENFSQPERKDNAPSS